MSVPPESLQVGQCYLTVSGHVRRVVRIIDAAKVQFNSRTGSYLPKGAWRTEVLDLRSFAFMIERPVPCDWTPERDEEQRVG